jgi:hypothetical protein
MFGVDLVGGAVDRGIQVAGGVEQAAERIQHIVRMKPQATGPVLATKSSPRAPAGELGCLTNWQEQCPRHRNASAI